MLASPLTTIFLLVLCLVLVIVVVWLHRKLTAARNQSFTDQFALQQLTDKQHQLDSAKADAEAANQAKNRYLSGISHELRTPLNVIMGYAQLLENQAGSNDPHKDKYSLMRHNCEHLAHLIEGILEFSAIESGKLKVQSDEFNLHELLDNLCLMFRTQAENKGLTFKTKLVENMPKWVKSDQKRVQQILINLLSNAIKFTEKGQVEFNSSYRNQVATFTVKDSGCGIKKEDLSRIFKPFERVEHSRRHIKGTGLGLSITQLLVDLLGGDIQVKSTPGQGSEFMIKIMLSAPHAEPQRQQQITSKTTMVTDDQLTLLLVDDEQSHLDMLSQILLPHGFKLLQANEGKTAQHIIENTTDQSIHLAILDVSMPGMSGWELAGWLKQNSPSTKIMMLSANPRDIESNQHQLHDAYLTKPIKIKPLLNQLNLLLQLGWNPSQHSAEQDLSDSPIQVSTEHKTALLNMVEIGHIKGIENYLQQLYADELLSAGDHQKLLKPIKHANLNVFKQMIQHETP